jgi:hypothetical protein
MVSTICKSTCVTLIVLVLLPLFGEVREFSFRPGVASTFLNVTRFTSPLPHTPTSSRQNAQTLQTQPARFATPPGVPPWPYTPAPLQCEVYLDAHAMLSESNPKWVLSPVLTLLLPCRQCRRAKMPKATLWTGGWSPSSHGSPRTPMSSSPRCPRVLYFSCPDS